MFSLTYLISECASVTGRVEIDAKSYSLFASGLTADSPFDLYLISKDGAIMSHERVISDINGNITFTDRIIPNHTMVCMLNPDNHKCVLRNKEITRNCLYRIQNIKQSDRITKSSLCKEKIPDSKIDTKVCNIHDTSCDTRSFNNADLRSLQNNIAVDILPELQLTDKEMKYQMYFEHIPAVKMPFSISKYWKFIAVESSVDDLGFRLFLGRHIFQGATCAFAKVIESTNIDSAAAAFHFPGFQYKKTPEGRSFWINVEDF